MADQQSSPEADPYLAREQKKYGKPVPSREYILEQLADNARPLGRRELAELFGLAEEDELEGLRRRLKAMERDGQLVRNRRNGYVIVDNEDLVRGRVRFGPEGWGNVKPDEPGPAVLLAPREMHNLLHGDRVVVRIVNLDREGRPEGQLVEVLERGNKTVTGRYYEESGVGFLVPDNKRLHQDVIIPPDGRQNAAHGQLAVAELLSQPSSRRQPIGRITEVIGEHIEPGNEIDVAARVHGIPTEWGEGVLEATEALGDTVPEAAKKDRVDLRKTPLVTIDGPDARDFDDAVYCEPTARGWKLIVAIADVAHYVEPGSALDEEAVARATSVYFPRGVVPMLPEALSNGLCSLNPKVDRLCLVCEMRIDKAGKIKRSQFYNGVMRSHARLTYDDVRQIHDYRDPETRKRFRGVIKHIDNLFSVYRALRKDRSQRGAIDFETTETAIEFNDEGTIRDIHPVERHDAHKLIEECMVKANVAAARFLERNKTPGLYRVHEPPTPERLDNLRQFLAQAGLRLDGGDEPSPKDFSRVMERVRTRSDRHLMETVMLKSMMAAEYRPTNAGHFGLALDAYAHFTSPIRRYPDLVVHRAIKHILAGGNAEDFLYRHDELITKGEHCSMADRRAEDASRDATMTLKCRFIEGRLGEEFNGVVSGVTSFGLFVQLDGIDVDGLIHITNLENDYFHFDPIGHRLTGERTGKEYRLADRIRVKVTRVNIDDRKIDFEPIGHPLGPNGEVLEHEHKGRGTKAKSKSRRAKSKAGRGDAKSGSDQKGTGKRGGKGGGPKGTSNG